MDAKQIATGLTAEEVTRLAVGQLLRVQPFFGTLLLRARMQITRDIPTAATDGENYRVNPDFILAKSRRHRRFVMAHEATHRMLMHVPRMKRHAEKGYLTAVPALAPSGTAPKRYSYNHGTFNSAADYYINALLRRVGVGDVPPDGLYRHDFDDPSMTAEGIYAQLCEEGYDSSPDSGSGGSGGGDPSDGDGQSGHGQPTPNSKTTPKNWDEHVISDDTPADDGDLAEQVKGDIEAAKQAAKAQGALSTELEEFVNELLKPVVDWRAVLVKHFRAIYGRDRRSYKKPHRKRMGTAFTGYTPNYVEPRMVSDAYGEVAVVLDTSGSISDDERRRYLTEIYNLSSRFKVNRLRVYMTHVSVYHEADIKSAEDVKKLPFSAGGTDMEAAFPMVAKSQPQCDTVIVLTDGYTTFDTSAASTVPCGKHNVVWLMTTNIKAPYGRNIPLEV